MRLRPVSVATRARWRPRGRAWLALAAVVVVLASGAAVVAAIRSDVPSRGVFTYGPSQDRDRGTSTASVRPPARPAYELTPAPPPRRLHVRFHQPPDAGLVFDLDSGQVAWSRHPDQPRPIASLTKMMTALLAVERLPRRATVPVTREALDFQGSGVGVLPPGHRLSLTAMLYGLLLPSGNDAAIALAQRVAGSVPRFVALMNARARELGLGCTRFSSPSGFEDRGNWSCPRDLALLAHAVMRQPLLARIVATRSAQPHAPVKQGRLFLYNNNPLLLQRYPGTLGIKTGYTNAAGLCIVAVVQRRGRRVGVVLLHTPNWSDQAVRLYERAFRIPA